MVGAGSLKKGDFVMLEGEPFKVDSIQSVVTGKHSHTKTKMELTGLFSGNKRSLSLSPHKSLEGVNIRRKQGQLIAKISEEVGQIMDTNDFNTCEARIPKKLMDTMNEGDELTYIEHEGRRLVLEARK